MTKASKIALGVAGAAAAGIAIGILVAPGKGSELRRRLKNKAGSLSDSITGKKEAAFKSDDKIIKAPSPYEI